MRKLALVLAVLALSSCGEVSNQETPVSNLCRERSLAVTDGAEASVLETSADTGPLAQSIRPDQTTVLTGFELLLKKIGTPSGLLTVTLEGNSGSGEVEDSLVTSATSPRNTPDGVPLGTAALFLSEVDDEAFDPYIVSFGKEITLEAGEMYWIRMVASYGASDTNLVAWGASTSNLTAEAATTEGLFAKLSSPSLWRILLPVGALRRDFLYQTICAD